jgi:hypothetical protein
MHFTRFRIAPRAAIAAATLAAILLLAAPAIAEDRGLTPAQGSIKLAQANEAPMVITPNPQSGQFPRRAADPGGPGVPYEPSPNAPEPAKSTYAPEAQNRGTFSLEEIKASGHRFFGSVSMGLAEAIEYAFQRAGRPNGYILGEEAGGAIVAGLRYGEGILHTKDAGDLRVYWQGPSLGYDFGAEGSKTMVLVYDLRSPGEIYSTFAGVDGSAYLIGGVGVTFLARGHLVLAPIRSGLGLRLGANVGYLKYTREPTWNPF